MWRLMLLFLPGAALADSLVAARTIRPMAILGPADVVLVAEALPGALEDPLTAIGMEARVALYPGRAIRPEDLGPPALIDRNQIVPLIYQRGALAIFTEGRALARGGEGDVIRVMNLASRSTVTGQIGADGAVRVGPQS